MTDKICVITPCYNAERYIVDCIESIISQEGQIEKHIIVDGGSTDGTVAILNEYAKKYDHLTYISENDEGQSDALNKALKQVTTSYFGWLNADDKYLSDKLKFLTDVVNENFTPSIVYGDYQGIDKNGDVIKYRRQPSFNYWDCLHGYLTIQNCAAIFNTQKVNQIDGFDKNLQFAMDYDLFLKLARIGEVFHVKKYIGQFRFHDDAKTSNLQSVCEDETKIVRHSDEAYNSHSIFYFFAKTRVFIRMLFQGCLFSRMGIDRKD